MNFRKSTRVLPLLLVLSLSGLAQNKSGAVMLKAGKAVTQPMQGSTSYDYQVQLKSGEALKATVLQKGVDVVINTYGPDGKKIASFDSPTDRQGTEYVTLVAPQTGRYRLEVAPFEPKAAQGTFELTVGKIMTPAQYTQSLAEDRKRADAVAAYLQTPHPDKTYDEQAAEVLKLDPTALMLPTAPLPEIEAARWLEGTWISTGKSYASAISPERTFSDTAVYRFDPQHPMMLTRANKPDGKYVPVMAYEPHSRRWVQASMQAGETGTGWNMATGNGWANNQLIMEGDGAFMGITNHSRVTRTKVDDTHMRLLTEERKGDGTWQPISEAQMVKQNSNSVTSK
ncbi:PPC domain-containing protein [Hymenobacter sp. BT491]|uniref:PPC domain-containing protein n=1 Tax=Hymenobacter sp. BT491 TaxID=2766779 RepID=UPI0016538EB3|nr:PPC domain-containing protein [Hymenobacter sp. BT491]MBC6988639.1 hypothetical protein [Hymenobacter sp. BT491]